MIGHFGHDIVNKLKFAWMPGTEKAVDRIGCPLIGIHPVVEVSMIPCSLSGLGEQAKEILRICGDGFGDGLKWVFEVVDSSLHMPVLRWLIFSQELLEVPGQH